MAVSHRVACTCSMCVFAKWKNIKDKYKKQRRENKEEKKEKHFCENQPTTKHSQRIFRYYISLW